MHALTSLVALALALAAAHLASGADYCSHHTISTDSKLMQFTKEAIPFEYGFLGRFKSIHCCVQGYRSIEWFKNGVPYPWPAGLSNLILYPEAANQTLYVRRAARSDAGDYMCRVSNQTHTQDHVISLQILKKLTDAPKTMYVSKDKWVEEGKPLRLFCEAMIARTFLADARSDLRWRKVWPNGTEGDLLPTQREINTSREDVPNVHGSYLTVARVAAQDYGQYACVVHSNNVVARSYVTVQLPRPVESDWRSYSVPWRTLLLGGAALALLAGSALAAHRRYTPRLCLLARTARALLATPSQRARGRLVLTDQDNILGSVAYSAHLHKRIVEKEFDVLVCCTPVDRALVHGALIHTLQHKYQYRVLGVQLPAQPDHWYQELLEKCARARALVAVVSPAQHSPAELLEALRQLRALPLPPVVVLLQDLPDLKREAKDSGETLVSVLRRTRLVPWRRVQDGHFWTQLRLALPLPPAPSAPAPSAPASPQPAAMILADLDASRAGSLTALV